MSDELRDELEALDRLPLYLTYRQVEENFGMSESTQRRLVREGRLQVRQLGERSPRITRSSLRQLIIDRAGEQETNGDTAVGASP